MKRRLTALFALAAIGALALSACGGGGGATATPRQPAATPQVTAAPSTPTAAPPRATPQASPTPAVAQPSPTPAAQTGVPTPIAVAGQRGGVLQIKSLFQPLAWDTFEARGRNDIHTVNPMLNNLIWPDPYGDGSTLVGDLASGWQVSADGKVITFSLRKGVTFHDGTPLTSKDVAYAFDRGWKPRTTTMTAFKNAFAVIEKVEAPDDLTVRITLSTPSNAFLINVGQSQFQVYPSHLPFPEKFEEWKKSPFGTGPFKLKSIDPNVKMEYVRNSNYFRPNLPYVDGITIPNMTVELALSAFRAGRLDATNFDSTTIERHVKILAESHGFVSQRITNHGEPFMFNQREPFTDPRVREAIDLALDRPGLLAVWLEGRGIPYAAPLLPPELNGRWGIPAEIMKTRPGFRDDKTEDLARAKRLLTEAGVDPGKFTINLLGNTTYPTPSAFMERTLASLGFKTKLEILENVARVEREQRGAFDIDESSTTMSVDDPSDYLAQWVKTGGAFNYAKWSDPKLDDLLTEQDRTLDVAKRKQVILEIQEIVLKNRYVIQSVFRTSFVGYMPWVKNFPPRLPFIFSPWYRWEQVYLVNR